MAGKTINLIRGYKLLRIRKDGSLGPLFINRSQRIPVGVWLRAESHPTKGFAVRYGWHGTTRPVAPHLRTTGDRVWCRCVFRGAQRYKRPAAQGGVWLLARDMKILRIMKAKAE